jgi:hypothetical protein
MPILVLLLNCFQDLEIQQKIMVLQAVMLDFKQTRAAFHPDSGMSSVGDKCHQLRASIKSLTKCALILGQECSIDEGRIASKSRYNLVWHYNSSKPDKYHIDFFVLVNTSQGRNFIYQIDVYQGKNATNMHIVEEARALPTTQKAIVNAVVSCGMSTNPDGMREFYMVNSYTMPELFVLLREKYHILACGKIWSNHKGWTSAVVNLSNTTPIGTSLVKYDPVKRILFGQWNDNKADSFISSLGVSGSVTVSRRAGSKTINHPIEESLKHYTSDNFKSGVNNVDNDKNCWIFYKEGYVQEVVSYRSNRFFLFHACEWPSRLEYSFN